MKAGRRRAPGLVPVLCALLLAACAREPLPAPGPVLERSAATMGKLSSVHFRLDVDGIVAPLTLRSVEGVLSKDGDAEGSVKTALGDELVQNDFVLAGGSLYLKGSTGGYQLVPESLSGKLYDPHVLLEPEHGLPAVIAGTTQARTVGRDRVGGVQAYRIKGRVTTELLKDLTILEAGQDRVPATLWISEKDGRLVKAEVVFRTHLVGEDTKLTVTLSKFDEPVDIKAPPTQ